MQTLPTKQSGAAAIWFVFVAIAIMGMGALGVEGARYITERAHLGDVMEATAIAVSESDDIRDDSRFDKVQAKKIATAWVNYLVPDNKGTEFNVSRNKHTYEKETKSGKVTRTVHQYKIDSTTTHDSWMYMKGIPSFDKQQKVYNKATAARVRTDFEPVDVVFVSDFSGSMNEPFYDPRLPALKTAISEVTKTIYRATKELQAKHDNVEDSSFAFVPFTKRIVVKEGNDYYCASMLRPKPDSRYVKPMLEKKFSYLGRLGWSGRNRWMNNNGYSANEKRVMEEYLSYAIKGGGGFYKPLDCNRKGGGWRYGCSSSYYDHISYYETANKLQLTKSYVLSTPMKIGHPEFTTRGYCSSDGWGNPYYYNIDRTELTSEKQLKEFNTKIDGMKADGGTDMYQGLLAAPGQFHKAKNKNRFVFVLSDGDENTDSFKKLVKNGMCKVMRDKLSVNEKGESVRFEMFVIGLQFSNKNDWAYRDCFRKHIYEVQDLNKLKDVIMELLSTTTSYNVER